MKKALLLFIIVFIIVLLVVALVAGFVVGCLRTIGSEPNIFTDGVVTATFDKSTETLTFSGNGAVYRTEKWLSLSDQERIFVRTIVFENGITSIGNCEFNFADGFINLEKVIFQGDINSIEHMAFWRNPNLTTVDFQGKCLKIDMDAFGNCPALTEVNVPDGCQVSHSAFEP